MGLATAPLRTARAWRSALDPDRWPTPPPPDGRPAVLLPGFLAGDPTLRRLALWLRSGGWTTTRSGLARNVDCMGASVNQLEQRIAEAVETAGRPAVVIGQSRGGIFARALAARRPDLVDTVITLGSPVGDELAVRPYAWPAIVTVGLLGSAGVPGLFRLNCARGPCCAPVRRELDTPLHQDVRFLALYSSCDEIVDWCACTSPEATNVDVRTSHLGMALDVRTWAAIADFLRAP